jgi:hypothetical protein
MLMQFVRVISDIWMGLKSAVCECRVSVPVSWSISRIASLYLLGTPGLTLLYISGRKEPHLCLPVSAGFVLFR